MERFEFVSGDDFRESLESDFNEISVSLKYGAWKAVHVLAGSIIEAVLSDYLIALDYESRHSRDPLTMELGPLITACRDEGILSQKLADLSSVVRQLGFCRFDGPAGGA
jgi:hypothetical protein